MKKVLIVLGVLLAVAIMGAVIFLVTLDVDSFRPQIISQVEQAIKKPVKLDKIALGWQSGIALELRGFAILKNKKDPEAFVTVDSAKAVLELGPLLSRKIQIATLYLDRPSLRLIKKADGTFEGFEPEALQPQPGQPQSETSSKTAGVPAFLVSKIQLDHGEVFYKDAFGADPVEVTVRKIDVTVENVALDQPIDFKAKAALFNNGQNLEIQGKLRVSSQDWTGTMSGLHGELQLAPIDLQALAKVSPAVQASGLVSPLEGTLTVEMDSLALNEQGLSDLAAKIGLERGKFRLQTLASPVENISVGALVTTAAVEVQKFTARVAGGTITGASKVSLTDPLNPQTVFNVTLDQIKIEKLIQASSQNEPQLNGLLSLTAKGQLAGTTPEQIFQTIDAQGTAVVVQAVILNQNILRDIFQKMSLIPGLVEKLLARLPENYQQKLKAKDTQLGTIQLPFSVQAGTAQLPKINVATDSFQVTGSGTYGLAQGSVSGNAVIAIEPELSSAMIQSVKELQYLSNAKKEIQIPVTFRGTVPDIKVMPDLQNIASRIGAQEAQKAIGGYLNKALGGDKAKSSEPQQPSVDGSSKPQSEEGVLGGLLREGMQGILSKQ